MQSAALTPAPAGVTQAISAFWHEERRRLAAHQPLSVGNLPAVRGRATNPRMGPTGFGIGQRPNGPTTDFPTSTSGFPDPGDGGLVPEQMGCCVASNNACEYHPALFCGWSQLPFSTFKSQGSTNNVDTGPVAASFANTRVISVTSERACYFRIRSIWFRSLNADDFTTALSFMSNVTINENPWVLEIGGIAVTARIGIPSALFDDTFWTLPVAWGVLSAIDNRSRPLRMDFITPIATDQQVIGMLFGDPLDECMRPKYGNTMVAAAN